VSPTGGYFNRALAPEGEVLSCSDKKVPKETLPRVCGRTHRGCPRAQTGLSGFAQGTSVCLGRTSGSLPDPCGPVLRLRWVLGLTKGAKKIYTTSPYSNRSPSSALDSVKGANKKLRQTPARLPLPVCRSEGVLESSSTVVVLPPPLLIPGSEVSTRIARRVLLFCFKTPLLKPSEGRSRSPGPKGHERDLVRPGQGQGMSLARGPTEASFERGNPGFSPGCPFFRFL
jgi:hypothetical protein